MEKNDQIDNRKAWRMRAKFNRSNAWRRKVRTAYVESDAYHWHRRVMRAFKSNAAVQGKIFDGLFDEFLKKAKS